MDFPHLQTHGALTHTTVAAADEEYPSCYQVYQGHSSTFQPAGLPAPDWVIVVNPMGFDDPEATQININECFEAYNVDVVMSIVRGEEEGIKQSLWSMAQSDAVDHLECDNGGAYALWTLPDGNLLVAGFDNGGSDIAQTGTLDALEGFEIVMTTGVSHYDPSTVLDDSLHNGLEHLILAGEITQRLMDAKTPKTSGPKP